MHGAVLDVADRPPADRHCASDFLRGLYLGSFDTPLDPRGPELVGVYIDGDLDLAQVDVPIPLRTRDCEFNGRVDLTGATTRAVRFDQARLVALIADGVDIRGEFSLHNTALTGSGPDLALDLGSAQIRGGVFLNGGGSTPRGRSTPATSASTDR